MRCGEVSGSERRRATRARWHVGLAAGAAVVLAALAALAGLQLALARVPAYRATLEQLVRARTGFQVQFDRLGLRWGWYGPEAVFRGVELSDPQRSGVRVHTAQLIVRIDAWRSVESGQLEAGRITLAGADIDLTGGARAGLRPRRLANAAPRVRTSDALAGVRAALAHWPNGRIDLEGGTLKLPGAEGSSAPTLPVRRAMLRRSGSSWSAFADTLLPQSLGRSLRISLELGAGTGATPGPSGTVRLDVRGAQLAGWRALAGRYAPSGQARSGDARPGDASGGSVLAMLPAQGELALHARLDWRAGALVGASGELEAQRLRLAAASGELAMLAGRFTLSRAGAGWHLLVGALRAGPPAVAPISRANDPQPMLVLDAQRGSVRGQLTEAPMALLLAAAGYVAPELDPQVAPAISGRIPSLTFDWSAARAPGAQLQFQGSVQALALGQPGDALVLEGVRGALSGTERALDVELGASDARLLAAGRPAALEGVRVQAHWQARRGPEGWSFGSARTLLAQGGAQLLLAVQLHSRSAGAPGSVQLHSRTAGAPGSAPPLVRVHALLTDADVGTMRTLLDARSAGLLGPAAARLEAGEIGRAELWWEAPLGSDPQRAVAFAGSVSLRQGVLAPQGDSPGVQGIDGHLEWRGANVHAVLAQARSGPFQLSSVSAQWLEDGAGGWRVSGQARGRIEAVLGWLRAHPDLGAYAAAAQGLQARGAAQFAFSAAIPPGARPAELQARIAAQLQADEVRLAPQLPPLRQVQGALVLDSGHLKSSHLSAQWLGGRVDLNAAEGSRSGRAVLAAHAHGVLSGARAVALAGLGLDPARVSGSSLWSGELEFAPAQAGEARAWVARFESPLEGIASSLPEPLTKGGGSASPVHIELAGAGPQARVSVTIGTAAAAVLQLAAGADGAFHPVSATLQVGPDAAGLAWPAGLAPPAERAHPGVFRIEARVHRLDLAAWLGLWRRRGAAPDVLPVSAEVMADELELAGTVYPGAVLHLEHGAGDALSVEAGGIAGVVQFPQDAAAPLNVHLERLILPEHPERDGGVWTLLGPEANIEVDRTLWRGSLLGSLSAHLTSTGQELRIDSLALTSPTQQLKAGASCVRRTRDCRLEFELTSADAAATFASLGFPGGLAAARARARGTLQWPWPSSGLDADPSGGGDAQPSLAGLHGRLTLELEDGEARTDAPGPGFALLAVQDLLRTAGAGSGQPVRFERLSADYDLHDGNAFTTDLHFDGDTEILMRGRAGFLARDFDYRAQILRAGERLPAALRRFAAAPPVAAAWLGLRDLIVGPPQGSRVVLRLSGSWDAPRVQAVRP